MPWIDGLYRTAAPMDHISDVNEHFIRSICARLGITTPICRSREFTLTQGQNERLIGICQQLGASEYLSGPAARTYLDIAAWQAAGISVRFKSYVGYPEYQQLFPPFEHGVTVLDLLFNTGDAASEYLRTTPVAEAAHG